MTVCLNSSPASYDPLPCAKAMCGRPSVACGDRSGRILSIGVVNNMPDSALEATERQFLSLLDAASDGVQVCVSLYSMPKVPRGEAGARHISNYYASIEELLGRQVDGLIVTGREPLTADLADEPYWQSFTGLVDWARENTYSTVWSCLAAHATVYYLDGVKRVKSNTKHCGVFECSRLTDHSLIAGAPSRFCLPHSRWNGLPEEQLTNCGYDVLTRANSSGVDSFVKDLNSRFVFFQGHPEYESNTLLLEYRRDVARYLRSEAQSYPSMPQNYFDNDTVDALTAIRGEAERDPRESLLNELSNILENTEIQNTWGSTAVQIYRNWIQQISARKNQGQEKAIFAERQAELRRDERSPIFGLSA